MLLCLFSRVPHSFAVEALAMTGIGNMVARVIGEFDVRLPEGFVEEE